MDPVIVQVILVATLAGFIQGLSGFAFALIATSLWAWMIEPQVLAPTVIMASLLGHLTSLSSIKTRLSFERTTPFLAGGAIGVRAGVLGGATGVPGPPIILWCALRGWNKASQRATFQSFFIGIQPLILGIYIAAGLVNARSLQLVLVAALPIMISSWIGSKVFRRFTDQDFQKVVFGLLLISGLALVSSGS